MSEDVDSVLSWIHFEHTSIELFVMGHYLISRPYFLLEDKTTCVWKFISRHWDIIVTLETPSSKNFMEFTCETMCCKTKKVVKIENREKAPEKDML